MMSGLRRAHAIASKELRQLRRDRLTFGMIVGIPVIQILLFGFAIDQDVRDLRTGIADLSGSQSARHLVADAEASQVAHVVRRASSPQALERLIRRGEVTLGIVIPRDFERRLARNERPAAQLLVDGSDPITVMTARGLLDMPPPARVANPPTVEAGRTFEMRVFYNPERRSAVHIVPALIGVILTLTMVLFTSVAIARERERGNLELLITTPISRVELMVGKIVPYIFIGLVQVTLILLLAVTFFRLPIRGSLLDLYVGGLLFIAASLAMGLLISTAVQTQFQAFQMTMFFFLPSILLSGFMFPFDAMPAIARWLAEILPLTHFVRIIRGIVLRGAHLGELWGEAWPLLLFFAVAMTLAVARFRKRLD